MSLSYDQIMDIGSFFVILALFGVLILAICLTRTAGVQRQVLKSGSINLACLIILAALFKILSGIISHRLTGPETERKKRPANRSQHC
jgi:uncharacterized membrane protein